MNKYIINFLLFISIYIVIINNNFSDIDTNYINDNFRFNYEDNLNYCYEKIKCISINIIYNFILYYVGSWLIKFTFIELIYI